MTNDEIRNRETIPIFVIRISDLIRVSDFVILVFLRLSKTPGWGQPGSPLWSRIPLEISGEPGRPRPGFSKSSKRVIGKGLFGEVARLSHHARGNWGHLRNATPRRSAQKPSIDNTTNMVTPSWVSTSIAGNGKRHSSNSLPSSSRAANANRRIAAPLDLRTRWMDAPSRRVRSRSRSRNPRFEE